MTTITIHRGELLQIKRIITRDKTTKDVNKGSLYGLYTESYQPVVLFVCGHGGDSEKIDKHVWENHKLLKLGQWFVSNSMKDSKESKKLDVTLIFDNKGNLSCSLFKENVATNDVIEGQSAFRELHSLGKYFKDKTGLDSSPVSIKKHQENTSSEHQQPASQSRSVRDHIADVEGHNNDVSCYTRTPQWYNTDRDNFQNTFEFVRRFTDDGTVEMSRNTLTENMTFKFNHSDCVWAIEFPVEFPRGVVIVRNKRGGEEKVSVPRHSPANLANMKNELRETFINMCKCSSCFKREKESWV